MKWTQAEYDAYQARRAVSRPKPEPPVCHGALAEEEAPGRGCDRFLVSITSFRTRLCDPDNLSGKGHVDCLRRSGIIPGDEPAIMDYRITQQKVKTKEEERTEIEITPL